MRMLTMIPMANDQVSFNIARTAATSFLGFGLLLLATSIGRAEDTPTERVAKCIENAWAKNVECQTNDTWVDDVFCAIRFEADVIACSAEIIPK